MGKWGWRNLPTALQHVSVVSRGGCKTWYCNVKPAVVNIRHLSCTGSAPAQTTGIHRKKLGLPTEPLKAFIQESNCFYEEWSLLFGQHEAETAFPKDNWGTTGKDSHLGQMSKINHPTKPFLHSLRELTRPCMLKDSGKNSLWSLHSNRLSSSIA